MILPENEFIFFKKFQQFSELTHCITTRKNGLNLRTEEGRWTFLQIIPASSDQIIVPHQVHGTDIFSLTGLHHPAGSFLPGDFPLTADGLITTLPGIWIGVFVADCIPILMYDPVQRVVAVVHAGWRGVAGGIQGEAVKVFTHTYGSRIPDVWVGIGPGIGQCCFEVGPEVIPQFVDHSSAREYLSPGESGHGFIDLKGIIRRDLLNQGILPDHLETMSLCTSCRSDLFYSYRREGKETGCMMLAAQIER
ncbi:MAG: peptidoglycan editing factor PgeF [Atribacterota bacterium]|nr:peptidoglycan editing factor PgeF [Candidatus Atribacteria bacterium]